MVLKYFIRPIYAGSLVCSLILSSLLLAALLTASSASAKEQFTFKFATLVPPDTA